MGVLLDTGILYAYYDRRDDWHLRSLEIFERETGRLIVPAPVIPEADHLLGRRLGEAAQATFYQGLSQGFFFVADLPVGSYARVLELNQKYADLRLGFVDAAVIAIAESLKLARIATTDRRDFGPLSEALSLTLLP